MYKNVCNLYTIHPIQYIQPSLLFKADSLHFKLILIVSFWNYRGDIQSQNDKNCVTVQILDLIVDAGIFYVLSAITP